MMICFVHTRKQSHVGQHLYKPEEEYCPVAYGRSVGTCQTDNLDRQPSGASIVWSLPGLLLSSGQYSMYTFVVSSGVNWTIASPMLPTSPRTTSSTCTRWRDPATPCTTPTRWVAPMTCQADLENTTRRQIATRRVSAWPGRDLRVNLVADA